MNICPRVDSPPTPPGWRWSASRTTWTGRIGLGEQAITAKTLRIRYLAIPGRLTVPARRPTLHLPARWPWRWRWQFALAGLRCIAYPT